MDRGDRPARPRDAAAGPPRNDRATSAGQDHDHRHDIAREDDTADIDSDDGDEPSLPLAGREAGQAIPGEQAEFREQFDEDLYNDREDRPAQGNTADVAMGDHRFGSEADAYSEYAWRRPGGHHSGDASSVGQARDPADVADEDERS